MAGNRDAAIVGIHEYPLRVVGPGTSALQIKAASAAKALEDAGLSWRDVDAVYDTGTHQGIGGLGISEYLGLKPSVIDTTSVGGTSYEFQANHAREMIAAGKCNVALITLAGRPRAEGVATGTAPRVYPATAPEIGFESVYGPTVVNMYAMAAMRHMHEFATTSEQLAWVKVAASHHAQHNEHAMLRKVVTVEDVVNSPMIADPLHRLDCCVISDGGGAIVVVSPEVAKSLGERAVKILGHGEAVKHLNAGAVDLTFTGGAYSGPRAFAEAGVAPGDIDYASIYDSFTITVVLTIEDLGFCARGEGGKFVSDGNLISGQGKLPFNTDGGGLCNNHPGNRGGLTKVLEAVRQVRGEAHPAVQVKDCALALAHGTGGSIATRMGSATVILGRSDA